MKRKTELNTVDVADRLNELARRASVIAVAVGALGAQPEVESGLQDLAWSLRDGIREISNEVHPDR